MLDLCGSWVKIEPIAKHVIERRYSGRLYIKLCDSTFLLLSFILTRFLSSLLMFKLIYENIRSLFIIYLFSLKNIANILKEYKILLFIIDFIEDFISTNLLKAK